MERRLNRDQATSYYGKPVYGSDGEKIGDVETILLDKATAQPEWVGIKSGFLGMKTVFAPLAGASTERDGLRVPYTKEKVKDGPGVDVHDDAISTDDERTLSDYYGVTYSQQASPSGLPTTGRSSQTSTGRWEDEMPRYRSGWEQRSGTAGGRWEEHEPSYRYGWEMRRQPNYQGRSWTEVEPELRRDWEARGSGTSWDRSRDSVRAVWEDREWAGTGEHIELREEELRAQKQSVQAGEVQVRKDVVTEQRTVDVPVTREEVYVERHPVEGRQASDRPIGEGETLRVPLYEEEVTVEKRPVVREEIEIGKRQVQDTERVSGTVRREEAHIEREGDVDVRGGDSDVERRGFDQR